MKGKSIPLEESIYYDLKLIAAKLNSKGLRPFLEDLYLQWVLKLTKGEELPEIPLIPSAKTGNEMKLNVFLSDDDFYQLNVSAAGKKTSLQNYMESIAVWLANEHRANGRVWIDDTPARALPIRMRK